MRVADTLKVKNTKQFQHSDPRVGDGNYMPQPSVEPGFSPQAPGFVLCVQLFALKEANTTTKLG